MIHRQLRLRVLESLERRAKQFRSREELWPFRVPHEPLALDRAVEDALEPDEIPRFDPAVLRSRTLLALEWHDGGAWEAWTIALPSGVVLYCDSGAEEARVLASARRHSPEEADHFFIELLAESRGEYFGIEMSGDAPDRVRTAVVDRDFLVDAFVEMYEGTPAQHSIERTRASAGVEADARSAGGRDFRGDVARWLDVVLAAPDRAAVRRARRPRRLRELES
ncbi:MAG: hypothetical protein A3H96_05395 [Acidobacteria bacterium RIFCSPLOWO2_02_FULL_67_36]|nr:MAG: hypothetical protein A3H96_05395 [Acidobacteria bacterium RIFCSPLOWO2_02_FULL_67_36]OFW21676.1 MAG: hypothetical protein A3G21_14880 [Acidobacteria bacterium RIFCSPLOWO2_12_FULL_66_21]